MSLSRHLVGRVLLAIIMAWSLGAPIAFSALEGPGTDDASAAEALRKANPLCCLCETAQVKDFCVKVPAGLISNCEQLAATADFSAVAGGSPAWAVGFACTTGSLDDTQCIVNADRTQLYNKGKCVAPPTSLKNIPQLLDPSLSKEAPLEPLVKPSLGVRIPDLEFGDAEVGADKMVIIPFLAQYIAAVYKYLVGIIGVIAIMMIMYGGFRYLIGSAAGDVKKGKQIVVDAVVGMFLLFSAVLILRTVNPMTVTPAVLRVSTQYGEPTYPDKVTQTKEYRGDTSKTAFDKLFQAYASCYSYDWRVLKAIASIESDLNPNDASDPTDKHPDGKYQGLFNIDREMCVENVRNGRYPPTIADCSNLKDPETNTAAVSYRVARELKWIEQKCPSMDTRLTVMMLYLGHNNGPAFLQDVLNYGGCTEGDIEVLIRGYNARHPNSKYARMVTPEKSVEKFKYGERAYTAAVETMGMESVRPPGGVSDRSCPLKTGSRVLPFVL